MATIAGLVVRIAGDTSGLRKEINAAQRQLNSAFGTKGMAFSKGLVKGMAAAGTAMGAMGVKALAEASKLQKVQVAFTNLLGSAQKADEYIRKLYNFANESPFSFEELSMGAQRLMAMGYEGEEALTTLRAIGDAAAGIGKGTEGISRISLALGQIKAKGTVQAEEMRQLAENGIPAWDMLAKKLGVDVATAMKMVEKRSVSAKVGIEALTEGMAGKYGGMMEKQAKTIEGGWQVAMDGVQRVLAQTGLQIDKTFDVAKNLRGFGLTLAKFSDEITESGITGALSNLIPAELGITLVGVAGTITGMVVPALIDLTGKAMLALLPWAGLIGGLAAFAGVVFAVGARLRATNEEIAEMHAGLAELEGDLNGNATDLIKKGYNNKYTEYGSSYHDQVSKDFNLYDVPSRPVEKAETKTETTNGTSDMAGPAVLAAAKRISKSINDEWNKLFKKRVESVDRWYTEEKDALDKSASENINYLTDKQRLEELYVQKRLNALKEEAEATRKIQDDVANLSFDSKATNLSLYDSVGKQEIEQMRLDYEKAIEDVNNKWWEQQNNFISMTEQEKATYLAALEQRGIAYEINANNELNFTKQIEAEKLAIEQEYNRKRLDSYRECADIKKDIDRALAQGNLAMLQQVLSEENVARLTTLEEAKTITQGYYDNYMEAHETLKQRVASSILETKDSLNTFFTDVLSYGSSFSESFGSLLSNIGNSVLSQVTGAASASITSGLLGWLGGGGEDKDNNAAKKQQEASEATQDWTKQLGVASNMLGKYSGVVALANTYQGFMNSITKPAETTATVTATSALTGLTASATAAAVALKAVSASGFASPLKFLGAATGGAIYGAGTGISDSIPAMLSNGEYVVRAAAVDKVGVPFLDAINSGQYAGFSTGGLVTPDYNSGKQVGGGGNQVINVSLNVSAIDASSFEDALRNGGLIEPIKQVLYDAGRDFSTNAGVW